MKKVIVIGGGISGLTCAIYLKLNDYDVEIYEKNHYAGGFLTSWSRKGSIIDGCLHWLLGTKKGTKINKIWDTVGDINSTEIITTESFYDTYYDGEVFHLYNDIDKFEKELYKFSKNDDDEIKALIEAIKALGSPEIPSDLPYELVNPRDLAMDKQILRKTIAYMKISVHDLAMRFNSPIIRYSFLNSLVNEKFNAFYFLTTLANLMTGNASLPKGGSHTLRDRMVNKFINLGGKIFYNSDVSEIIIEENKAKGIIVNNEKHYADYVVGACDVHYTYNVLLKNQYPMDPYVEMNNDKVKYPDYSFIIASYRTKHDFKGEICQLIKVEPYHILGKEYDYLSVRAYDYDETLMNGDYRTVQVMLTTYDEEYDYINKLSDAEYENMKKEVGKLYQEMLEKQYNDSFELLDVLTPKTYERYNHSFRGTFMTYALTPKTQQMVRSMLIDGLDNFVMSNQWLYLPGGTPAAVVNGKFACQIILYKDERDYKI
ncbi:MAG: FAD-dependent oxidoreductase [Acholeplasmatales bacterium]|nr:FAD-dependent oxidoreductase [Acholeplasmatales bacterium]